MFNLKEIWKNRKKILEGIKNAVLRDEFVEAIAKERWAICKLCESNGDKCAVPGTQPCCGECGCSLGFKLRSLSSDCPLDKWKAVMTQEQEDKLNEL
tara:strand:- start:1409 stop:1699 length:291 start_codon:yes stop_codon:yes gene_type:complete